MQNETSSYINSPVIQRNTPIKRLGLSRKRKSSGSGGFSVAKVRAFDKALCNELCQSPNEKIPPTNKLKEEPDCLLNKSNLDISNESFNDNIDYESEIESLKKRISEKEKELAAIHLKISKVSHLEDLTESWRIGCKNAFLYLIQLVKERQSENVDIKTILKGLGIFKTMAEHFENDSEIFF